MNLSLALPVVTVILHRLVQHLPTSGFYKITTVLDGAQGY